MHMLTYYMAHECLKQHICLVFAHVEGEAVSQVGTFGVCGWWWGVGVVVNLTKQPQITVREQACTIKRQAFSLSFLSLLSFCLFFMTHYPAPGVFLSVREDNPGPHTFTFTRTSRRLGPIQPPFFLLSLKDTMRGEKRTTEKTPVVVAALEGWKAKMGEGEGEKGRRENSPLCFC